MAPRTPKRQNLLDVALDAWRGGEGKCTLEPRGSTDMTGWHELTCEQYETVMGRHRDMPIDVFKVASTITDPDGNYGSPLVFTEWWYMDTPLLRSYLWGRIGGDRRCEHYGAIDETAAVVSDD